MEFKIEKVGDNAVKITGPAGSKVGANLTPEQLLADMAKHLSSQKAKGAEPNCAVCIAD
jgi:hypothetical protein